MDAAHEAELDSSIERLIKSEPEAVADPFPLYRRLLELPGPYQWGPTLVVSHFDAVKQIASDAVTFSNAAYSVGSRADSIKAGLGEKERVAFDEVSEFEAMYISRSDGEQHARMRDIAHRAFTPRKMAALEDRIQRFTDDLLRQTAESEDGDFVAGLSGRLPIMAINSLLDVPLEDIDLIKGWTARIGKNRGGAVIADLMDAHAALAEFRDYVGEIVAHHRQHPDSTDLVSALMGAAGEDRLSEKELLATMVVLLFGGSDTTTALLGNGLYSMLREPQQWGYLAADPEGRVEVAAEELARFVSPVQTTWRVTTAPTEIAGVEVDTGSTVLVMVGAANRDRSRFEEPEELRLDRAPNGHIAYFFGKHFCLGASLARLEARTVMRTVAGRFPETRLRSPEFEAVWQGNIQFRSIASLPVDFGTEATRKVAA